MPKGESGTLITLATAWWQVSTKPSIDTFKSVVSDKSHLRAFVSVLFAAVLGIGLSWITHRLLHDAEREFMGLAAIWVKSGTPAPWGNWLVLVPLGVIYGFYSFEIVLFIFAWLLGGRGSFREQSYVQSLFYSPLALVQQILAVIPVVGVPLFMLVAAGSLIPTTTSLRAAHGYSTLRAILTWVIPIVLNVVVVTGIVILLSQARR